MFGRNRSVVVEPLQSVSAVKDLLADIGKREGDLTRLRDGLRSATQETERLAHEEQEQRDAMYRHAARAHVNPEEQATAEQCHERARTCAERRIDLQRQIAAFEQEIQQAEKSVERLRIDLGRARRTAWEDILSKLLKQFGDEHRELLLQIWTAIDQLHNGAHAVAVLHHLGFTELDTTTKLLNIDKLCDTYGLPKH